MLRKSFKVVFTLPQDICALRDHTRRFIADQVIPLENDERQTPYGPSEMLRRELVERARAAGLLTRMRLARWGSGSEPCRKGGGV
jgi:hypothetical protein